MTMAITPNNRKCWMKNSQISIEADANNDFYVANALSMGTMAEYEKIDETLTLITPVVEENRGSVLRKWHIRLGHANMALIKQMSKDQVVHGMCLKESL